MDKPKPTEEEMWAGPSGQRWLENADRFETSLQPIGDELIRRAPLSAGAHVIDVGCGAGALTLAIAERVAPGGSVTGLDISPQLVTEATRRAAARQGGASIRFFAGDAARTTLPSKADFLVSRFGIMFFTDPYGAFAHLRTLLRPGGKLVIACWAPLPENPWMLSVRSVMAAHFDLPVPPPRTPGPFAFDQPDYLRDILGKSGFSGIDIAHWETRMYVGGPGSDPESARDFLLQAMSVAQRAAQAPEALKAQIRAELCDRLRPFMTPGGVNMPAAVWFATAVA